MEIKKNESLKKYTTIKIGGIAENLYMVKTTEDIINVVKECKEDVYILGKGSNLIINDKKTFKHVINMNSYEKTLEQDRDITIVSASVKVQQLINFVNKHNRGGIEYLYSVPCTVGGAIAMNAGRGKNYNLSISDYLIDVTIYDGENLRILRKEECDFEYRDSIFKTKKWIILSARFKFDLVDEKKSTELKKERIQLCKEGQDAKYHNAGSCFRTCDRKIMTVLRKIGFGFKNGICFSRKTNNWLNNYGNGTFNQAMLLIKLTTFIHKLLFKPVKVEYIIWD